MLPASHPMHIAFFNRSFYPETAATGQFLTELCEGLSRDHGCRVSVVAGVPLIADRQGAKGREPKERSRRPEVGGREEKSANGRPGHILERENHAGIEILRARGTRFPKAGFAGRFCNYVSYFLSACYAGLRLERPDVIVALTDPPIIGLAAYLAARRFRAPLVMSYQDIFPEAGRLLDDFHSRVVDRSLDEVNRFLVRSASRVVALGETMRKKLIEGKGAERAKTLVIPLWADCSEITPGPKLTEFSKANGLADKFVVMHSGNIGLSQGLEVLLGAANELRHLSDLEVVFVGDGVRKAALMEQARILRLGDKARFLPFQPKEKLTESFAAADVFVVSLKRGLAGIVVPSKLYGILAAGRPYVAAVEPDCEVAQITREYDCGLVAEPDNPKDLAEKLLFLYENRDQALRLGENGRKAAFHFDRKVGVRAYYELFCELAAEKKSEDRSQRPEVG